MLNKHLDYYILIFSILIMRTSTNEYDDCVNNYNLNCQSSRELSTGSNYYFIFSDYYHQSGTSNSLKHPQIILSDYCLNKLKNNNEDKKIIVGRVFSKFSSNSEINNEITDLFGYKFYYYTEGQSLLDDVDIHSDNVFQTVCKNEDITYYLPIYSEDDSLPNKYINVIRQNKDNDEEDSFLDYDIFNPDADIYNDICTTITFSEASENTDDSDEFVNYDITLHERRKYYFPGNIEYCLEGLTYKGIDKETFSFKCQTTVNSNLELHLYGQIGLPTDHHSFSSFKADSDFKKEKRDIYFSMDVFKCIKLPFTFRGFKGNYGSYFMIALMIIVVICYLILLIAGKIHLLSVLELLYNSNIQSTVTSNQ